MCNLSLGIWMIHLHILCPIFKEKNACSCCLEIFVDFKIVI
jgi:hypothetical protein